MKQIKIIDFYSIKTFHEVFNTSLVAICSNISERVIYKAPKSYIENIKVKLQSVKDKHLSRIFLRKRLTVENDTRIGSVLRHLIGFWICLWEYFIINRKTILIFNYTNYFSLPIILIINRYFKRKVIFIIHGELGLVDQTVSKYSISWLFKTSLRISLKNLLKKSNTYFLVLGDSIKENILQLYPYVSYNIISICHPVINIALSKLTTKERGDKLIIGTVGVMNKNKGFESLHKLSNMLKKEIKDGKLEIRCLGKVHEIDTNKYPLIQWINPQDVVSRNVYEKNIKELDYIVFLYDKNSYRYSASGAIFDSLISHRPILTLKNDYFNYILKDVEIGYTFDSITQMYAKIIELINQKSCHTEYEKGFNILMKKTSLIEVGKDLTEKLQEKGYC